MSQWIDEPMQVPHLRVDGWWVTRCDGTLLAITQQDVLTDGCGGVLTHV